MPNYSELQADPAYRTTWAGAAIRVMLVNESNTSIKFVGLTTSLNINTNFEQMPVEESGAEVADEITTGRSDCALSMSVLWTPEKSDQAPTAENFIGQGYWTLLGSSASKRPKEATILFAVRGCKFSNRGDQFASRGQATMSLSAVARKHQSGAEWAAESGT